MSGETHLVTLLRTMTPEIVIGDFVFCSLKNGVYGDYADLNPMVAVQESEGLTLVVARAQADAQGLAYGSVMRCIKLNVHSSLDAVGLTAAVAGELTREGISANVVAGYYHDYLFVQGELAQRALAALVNLAQSAAHDQE
jgi:uncharacterized protein